MYQGSREIRKMRNNPTITEMMNRKIKHVPRAEFSSLESCTSWQWIKIRCSIIIVKRSIDVVSSFNKMFYVHHTSETKASRWRLYSQIKKPVVQECTRNSGARHPHQAERIFLSFFFFFLFFMINGYFVHSQHLNHTTHQHTFPRSC